MKREKFGLEMVGIIIIVATIVLFLAACDDFLSNDDEETANPSYGWYGNGSANSFTISNATQLLGFARIVNGTTGTDGPAQSNFNGKTVTLSADINLNSQSWTPIGSPYITGNGPFLGTFDGNGKSISGLYSTAYAAGLFGSVGEGGIVKNIILSDVSIPGDEFIGGVAAVNRGIVQNCIVTGSLTGGVDVGGIVGINYGTVQYCSFSGSVSSSTSGGIIGFNYGIVQYCYSNGNYTDGGLRYLGGIAGYNDGTVRNCYSIANLNGNEYVGGVVGFNSGIVQNCYATGNVIANTKYSNFTAYAGGIAGRNGDAITTGTVQNCVALNSSVSNTSTTLYVSDYTTRVAVSREGSLSNNYALSEMTLPISVTVTSDINGEHGEDISALEYNSQTWWTTASNWNSVSLWNFTTIWDWDDTSNLPKLRMQ